MSDIKTAIDNGDASALRQALVQDPALVDTSIIWGEGGKNHTHPLHYVSDKVFDRTLTAPVALALVDVLLEAGANVNGHPSNGETPLLGAASLDAEDVGLRLLDAGADFTRTGSFAKETALHWAAHQGLDRLVARLLDAGADPNLRDSRWNGTPIDWAEHGRKGRSVDDARGYAKVVALLQPT